MIFKAVPQTFYIVPIGDVSIYVESKFNISEHRETNARRI